jgi:hypothetical protein
MRRVLWSNVGNTFEAMLTKVEAVSGRKDRLDAARWVINQRSLERRPTESALRSRPLRKKGRRKHPTQARLLSSVSPSRSAILQSLPPWRRRAKSNRAVGERPLRC